MIYYIILILYYFIGICFFIGYDWYNSNKKVKTSLTEKLIDKNNIV